MCTMGFGARVEGNSSCSKETSGGEGRWRSRKVFRASKRHWDAYERLCRTVDGKGGGTHYQQAFLLGPDNEDVELGSECQEVPIGVKVRT